MSRERTCRWCENYVPRARMCVDERSGRPGMPLRRGANESCNHFLEWRPVSPDVQLFQRRDRIEAYPRKETE